ncbi:hypothetical protein OB905_10195 [Halobacteria archaeon AArc-dxtr1]|nr:hypothetical protein [Halobacteria archaeon AArc-dxtr1]
MSTDTETLTVEPSVDGSDLYPLVRITLLVGSGLLVVALASLLPGLEQLFGWLPISLSATLLALGTYLLVAGLLAASPVLERLVRSSLDGPEAVVTDVAASAKYVAVFSAIPIAHWGFEPPLAPAFATVSGGWLYHLTFLALALLPLALLIARIRRCLDPLAELLANQLAGSPERSGETAGRVRRE